MKRLFLPLLPLLAALVLGGTAAAGDANAVGAAYAITNSASGNSLVVYARAADGTLAPAGQVAAGGLGTGAGLASQGAVTLSDDGRYVVAVNPGSNSVAAFALDNGGPRLLGTAPSAGNRPVSVAVRKGLVYVLNKDNASQTTISGFTLGTHGLTPIAGSTRPVHAGTTDGAQVRFTPDGRTLVVTGRSSNAIDTFRIGADGLASDLRSYDVAPGGVPFGFDFDKKGHLLVSLAGVGASSGAASYAIGEDGSVATITSPIESGQRAACWLVASKDGRFAFVANAASGSISTFAVAPDGSLEYRGALTIAGMTPLDLGLSESGRYLYVLAAGSHGIVELEVGNDGSLSQIGAQANIPATATGLAVR
jgi:6-phosphogluconolactonase